MMLTSDCGGESGDVATESLCAMGEDGAEETEGSVEQREIILEIFESHNDLLL